MAVMSPGAITGFNLTTFAKRAAPATYQEMIFIPMVEDYGMKVGTTGTVRKALRLTASVLGQSANGAALTAATLADAAVTLTAAGNVIMVQWDDNFKVQTDIAVETLASGEVERALAEASDTIALANVSSGTQNMSNANVDAASLRQALGRLGQNTNGEASPGKAQIYAVFSMRQYPFLATIPEFNNAEIRGDAENPFVKGIWMRGGGVILNLSTAVANDANGDHNPIFIREAFQIGWNTARAAVETQRFEVQTKVIAFKNFASGVIHNLRFIDFRTTTSGL